MLIFSNSHFLETCNDTTTWLPSQWLLNIRNWSLWHRLNNSSFSIGLSSTFEHSKVNISGQTFSSISEGVACCEKFSISSPRNSHWLNWVGLSVAGISSVVDSGLVFGVEFRIEDQESFILWCDNQSFFIRTPRSCQDTSFYTTDIVDLAK